VGVHDARVDARVLFVPAETGIGRAHQKDYNAGAFSLLVASPSRLL